MYVLFIVRFVPVSIATYKPISPHWRLSIPIQKTEAWKIPEFSWCNVKEAQIHKSCDPLLKMFQFYSYRDHMKSWRYWRAHTCVCVCVSVFTKFGHVTWICWEVLRLSVMSHSHCHALFCRLAGTLGSASTYRYFFLSTSLFFQLFLMRRERLQQQVAAWRKNAAPSMFFSMRSAFFVQQVVALWAPESLNFSAFQKSVSDLTGTPSLSKYIF